MLIIARRLALFALCVSTAAGCASIWHHDDDCQEPRRYSEAWYAAQANSPVGARQVEKCGKLWPPYPRPVGPEQPCCHRYHASHYWPWPYNCTDRQYLMDVTQTQEANGWLCETTLYDYHFNADSNELTVPGKLQLKWILEEVPPSYRTVWVQQLEDSAAGQQRLNNVRANAIKLVGEPNVPPIAFRLATAPARPAIEVDTIRRHELDTIPQPRVPLDASASGSSSTSTGQGNN